MDKPILKPWNKRGPVIVNAGDPEAFKIALQSVIVTNDAAIEAEMVKFKNRIRALFNIDGNLLPELDEEEQGEFQRDPVDYWLNVADKTQSLAIWREAEKRWRMWE